MSFIYTYVLYLIALTYQQMGRWRDAVDTYKEINSVALNQYNQYKQDDMLTGECLMLFDRWIY